MNSFNHYAYGAIGDWMYRVMVGLDIEEGSLAYKEICIRPHIGGNFTHASASYETPYGKLISGWQIEGQRLTLSAEIPANTTATLSIPLSGEAEVMENNHPIITSKNLQVVGRENDYLVMKVGSGKYEFSTAYIAR